MRAPFLLIDKKIIAISTLWSAERHEDGMRLVFEAKGLGFEAIEGNYKITEPILADISAFVERGEVEVVSLHHFTPLPAGLTKSQEKWRFLSVVVHE